MTTALQPLPFLNDPALPLLSEAWAPGSAHALLSDAVLPVAWPDRRASTVAIEDVIYQPRRECAVLYRLTLDDGSERHAVATFSKDDRLTQVYDRHYPNGGERDRPVVLLREHRCLVEFFGMDWRLPALARETGSLDPRRIEVLRYRPHERCVLGGRSTVTKVFRDPAQAARTLKTLSDLRRVGPGPVLRTPAPLELSDATVLRMERLRGEPLRPRFDRGTRTECEAAVVAAAAALVAFHGLPVATDAAPRTVAGEIDDLRRKAMRIAPVARPLAVEIEALTDRLEAATASFGPAQQRLVHGDFKPSQLVVLRDGMAIVDLDRASAGDPAVDIGNFMAQMPKQALLTGRDDLRPLAERFLAEYLARDPQDGLAERARLVQSLALARMMARRFFHKPHTYGRSGPAWRSARLIREARACLPA